MTIKWQGKNIPIIYACVYRIMKERTKNSLSISYSEARDILRRRLHKIPHLYHGLILKEMEGDYNLLKKIGNKKNLIYEFTGNGLDKQLNKEVGSLF